MGGSFRRQAAVQLCCPPVHRLLYDTARHARHCFALEAERINTQYPGPYFIGAAAYPGVCHALERGYRRAALFQEPAGIHQLHAAVFRQGGSAGGTGSFCHALCDHVHYKPAPAVLGERVGYIPAGISGLVSEVSALNI